MKVYIVSVDEVYDFEKFYHEPRVFAEVNDAISLMNDIVKKFEEENNPDDFIIERDDTSYTAYEDGRYPENHFCVQVYCKEVETTLAR